MQTDEDFEYNSGTNFVNENRFHLLSIKGRIHYLNRLLRKISSSLNIKKNISDLKFNLVVRES